MLYLSLSLLFNIKKQICKNIKILTLGSTCQILRLHLDKFQLYSTAVQSMSLILLQKMRKVLVLSMVKLQCFYDSAVGFMQCIKAPQALHTSRLSEFYPEYNS